MRFYLRKRLGRKVFIPLAVGKLCQWSLHKAQFLKLRELTPAVNRPSALMMHLRSGEKVLWSGKPAKLAFLFSTAGGLFGLLVMSFLFVLWCSLATIMGKVLSVFDFMFIVVMLMVLSLPIWQLMRYPNTEYMITNQRLITQTGAIGLDTRFVDLDKIQEVHVQVGVTDKILGTGSVIAATAGFVQVGTTAEGALARPSLAALKEPYKVQKLLQEALP